MKLKQLFLPLLLSVSTWFSLPSALAQAFPDRPVRLVVPYPAGGPVDFIARSIQPELAKVWGQPVVIDNIGGGSGMIGGVAVSRSKPDGYTLLIGGVQTHAMNAGVIRTMPYHPLKDFTPIIQTTSVPWLIVANTSLGIRTPEEMIAAIRAKPGHFSYASSGIGSAAHLTFASLLNQVGAKALHVPYKGTAQAIQDVIGGQVHFGMADENTVMPHIRAGSLVAIASAGKERLADSPNLPTLGEKALPGFEMQPWHVIYGPANMDPELVKTIAGGIRKALEAPGLKERLKGAGVQVTPAQPEPMVTREYERWVRAARDANVVPE
jgi:tripartite-type tricarboxylate transporter receptor subunit TctC